MQRSVVHASFTLTRAYGAPAARVFQAFADEDAKSKWFFGPPGWNLIKRVFDFREGGREHLSGRFEDGTVTSFDCIYHDIVENERIIYSYVMEISGRRHFGEPGLVAIQARRKGHQAGPDRIWRFPRWL